jgi:hypothetical protein
MFQSYVETVEGGVEIPKFFGCFNDTLSMTLPSDL